MAPQVYDWTCSACSLDWLLRSTGADPNSNREKVTYEIGYTENINPTYGLMDGSGAQLRRVLAEFGLASNQGWLDFESAYAVASLVPGMMSGSRWYHWVAVRGVLGNNLWIANSAPGYKGVWDILSAYDYNRLGGFSVVWLAL
jgi:hypothetical protein